MQTSAVILAAGEGTRMHSDLSKVLHPLAGEPIINYSLTLVDEICTGKPIVVIGHAGEQVRQIVGERAEYALQEEQLGTAHALQSVQDLLINKTDLVLVLYADMPLITKEVVTNLIELQSKNEGVVSMITVELNDSHGFGRVVRDQEDNVIAIVEEAQATPEQINIKELNAGIYCFNSDWLWPALKNIKKSAKGEFYLTDVIELAVKDKFKVNALKLNNPEILLGINNKIHLAEAEAIIRKRINEAMMLAGVTIEDPKTTYIDPGVKVGKDTVIKPNTHIQGGTTIGERCVIGPNSIIVDTMVGDECTILSSMLESAVLEDHVEIGPYGHLRKGAHLASGVHMGNFGEVKNSYLGPETKMGHFSYLGDAQIGKNVNIGAGTITCNFDGVNKHKTIIEDDVFIGSDTMLVAPLKIGKEAKTGAGSVVRKDVPPNSVVVGVPADDIKKRRKNSV